MLLADLSQRVRTNAAIGSISPLTFFNNYVLLCRTIDMLFLVFEAFSSLGLLSLYEM